MKLNNSITSIMSTDLITATINENIYEVIERMKVNFIRHIPIMDGNKVSGLLSKSDIIKHVMYNKTNINPLVQNKDVCIKEIMTTKLITLTDNQTIKDAIDIFNYNSFHSIPITDIKGDLIGVVSIDDLWTSYRELALQQSRPLS